MQSTSGQCDGRIKQYSGGTWGRETNVGWDRVKQCGGGGEYSGRENDVGWGRGLSSGGG